VGADTPGRVVRSTGQVLWTLATLAGLVALARRPIDIRDSGSTSNAANGG